MKMSVALIEVFSRGDHHAFRFLRIVDASKMSEIPQYTPIVLESGTTRVMPIPLQQPVSLGDENASESDSRARDEFEKFEDLLQRRVRHAVQFSERRKLGQAEEFVELSDVAPINSEESMKQQRRDLEDSKVAFLSELLDHDFAHPRPVAREQQYVCMTVSADTATVLNVHAAFESAHEAESFANLAVTRGDALSMEVLQSCKWFSSHDFRAVNLPQTVYVDNANFMNAMMQKASENRARAMSMQKTAQNLGGDLVSRQTPPVQVVHTIEGGGE